MATCPQCGATNVTGKFCGTCGAAMPAAQTAASVQPQPPQVPSGQAPAFPGQQAPPQFPGGQTPPPFPGQQVPPQFPGRPVYPPNQVSPNFGPAPQPQPRKSSVGKIIGIVLGSIVGLVVLGIVIIMMLPDPGPGPTDNPGQNVVNKDQPATPGTTAPTTPTTPTQPTTPPANNDQGQKMVKTLAQGQYKFDFQSYDGFAGNQLALARSDGKGNVEMVVLEFSGGTFQEAIQAVYPLGQLNDVNHGKIFNDGKDYAIAPADDGIIIVPEDDDAQTLSGKGFQHVLVGDWDGDGKYETITFLNKDGANLQTYWRYGPDGNGEKLGQVSQAPLKGLQVASFKGEARNYVLGIAPDSLQKPDQLVLATFTASPTKGFEFFGYYPVHQTAGEQVTGYAAGTVAGVPTLVVAYQPKNGNSYLELFDIRTADVNKTPPSRGKIELPANDSFQVILGNYTQKQETEILLLDMQGNWYIAGF
jgi:hypothetical protein